MLARGRESAHILVQTDFSAALLSVPTPGEEAFPPYHMNLITPTMRVFFSPHAFYKTVRTICLEENVETV